MGEKRKMVSVCIWLKGWKIGERIVFSPRPTSCEEGVFSPN